VDGLISSYVTDPGNPTTLPRYGNRDRMPNESRIRAKDVAFVQHLNL